MKYTRVFASQYLHHTRANIYKFIENSPPGYFESRKRETVYLARSLSELHQSGLQLSSRLVIQVGVNQLVHIDRIERLNELTDLLNGDIVQEALHENTFRLGFIIPHVFFAKKRNRVFSTISLLIPVKGGEFTLA